MRTANAVLLCGVLAGAPALGQDVYADVYGPAGAGGHHLPLPVAAQVRLGTAPGGRFDILVRPNLLTRRQALGLAARRAAAHCGAEAGVAATIDVVARHAYSDLDSWGFSGACR